MPRLIADSDPRTSRINFWFRAQGSGLRIADHCARSQYFGRELHKVLGVESAQEIWDSAGVKLGDSW